MDLRKNLRTSLETRVDLSATDREGKLFEAQGVSTDFSRKGLGLLLDRELLPGSEVSVRAAGSFRSRAVVQWTAPDRKRGRYHVGLRLIAPKLGVGLRIAVSLILCIALIDRVSFARSQRFMRSNPRSTCTVSLAQMRNVLERSLGGFGAVTNSERAFVHVQHQRLSCEEYTRLFEKSRFYTDKKKRSAIADWHWRAYHAEDGAVRATAIENAESALTAH
jgi:hypothetical protein